MAAKFEDGSIVQLKSGSPLMTVDSYFTDGDVYFCKWFQENKLYTGEFKGATLEEYEPEQY